ncbi:Preprotein translocase subunit SecY [Buchnera aphidicola (Thelaxes suberi)]|uniref:preprotein translocase subunit SecY n=1 Tax=Buchnera aphidicola TaxID=9 RepID=UPI0034648FF5
MNKYSRLHCNSNKKNFNQLIHRIFFVICALLVFRIGSFIPIPGIDTTLLSDLLGKQKGAIIEVFNMFSGGALSRASIFALGVMPYISASIIVQLLTLINNYFAEMKKSGLIGKNKINRYIRYITLALALLQSIGLSIGLPNIPEIRVLIMNLDIYFYCTAVLSLTAGTMFLMWLGELITDRGIGNGISLIIFTGIISSFPTSLENTLNKLRLGELHGLSLLFIFLLIFFVIYFVVFIEKSQRNITIQYIRRQQGRHIYTPQETFLPLKINISGVMPAIFASSFVIFPSTLIVWLSKIQHWNWLTIITKYFSPNHGLYMFVYAMAIIFFCFFYTDIIFNPRETAENLKKTGSFIPGIRPGEKTASYINKIAKRLTVIGSAYITFICLLPEILRAVFDVPFYFGGTSLLIVVVVIIEFIAQIQSLILSTQYSSIMKKSHLNFN